MYIWNWLFLKPYTSHIITDASLSNFLINSNVSATAKFTFLHFSTRPSGNVVIENDKYLTTWIQWHKKGGGKGAISYSV